MNRFEQLMRQAAETPWAILPAALEGIMSDIRSAGVDGEQAAIPRRAKVPESQRLGSVGVIPIHGPIGHRASFISEYFGWPTAEGIKADILTAANDPEITSVVLDIQSPGGTVPGIPELAEAIQTARKSKRIVALANSYAASAAYWIGASASELVVIPSGEVGSIGVFTAHIDVSKSMEKWGEKVTLISAGKYKTEGNPFEPLSDEAKAFYQARVDEIHEAFIAAVASGRNVPADKVRAEFGQGRMVRAKDAVRKGMADRVATMDDVLGDEILRARRVTGAGLRASIKTKRDFEDFLRDAGSFSNAEAKRIASAGFREDMAAQDLRDGGGEPTDDLAKALREFNAALGQTTSQEGT